MLIVNARYLLMSASLSQKLAPNTPLRHRMLVAFDVTDEIFGISVAVKGTLNPYYNYGAMTVSIPCWATGAMMGVLMGNILPQSIVSALSVGLYGMFLAIIIPPARKDKIIAGIIVVCFTLSFLSCYIPFVKDMSDGTKTIVLTVLISTIAAIMFPHKEERSATND
jgi:predicted branched-subunit amino acid permease